MCQVAFHCPEEIQKDQLLFVVGAARYRNRWVFSRHKQRSTWDMPGGHIEPGESPAEAMPGSCGRKPVLWNPA